MTDTRTPEEIARDHTHPQKFNLLERLTGRNLPSDTVIIYLDENAQYHVEQLDEEIAGIAKDDAILKEKEALRQSYIDQRDASAVKIHLRGISSKRYDELVDEAQKEFPLDVEITQNPLTGRKDRIPVPNPERDTLFMKLQWVASIAGAELPGGDTADDNIDLAWISLFLDNAPVAALALIAERINKLRMATDWMDGLQSADFSQRS